MTERAAPLTRQEIWDTADALLAAGENPTQLRVLEALGRGSSTTINKHLKAWREARDETYSATRRRPTPAIEDVPPEVATHFGRLWELAFAAARDQVVDALVSEREAVAEERRKAEEAQNQAAQQIEKIESRLEGERLARVNLQTRCDELEDKLADTENEVRSLSEKLAAAETRERAAQEKIAELQDTLQSARDAHAEAMKLEQERSDALEARLVKAAENERAGRLEAENRVSAREAVIAELQKRVDRAFALLEEANRVQAGLREEASAAADTINRQRERLEALQQDLARQQARREAIADELALRLNEIEALRAQVDQANRALADRIDPAPLVDWIESGMKTSPRKTFGTPELRDVAHAVEQMVSKLQQNRNSGGGVR